MQLAYTACRLRVPLPKESITSNFDGRVAAVSKAVNEVSTKDLYEHYFPRRLQICNFTNMLQKNYRQYASGSVQRDLPTNQLLEKTQFRIQLNSKQCGHSWK